MTDSAAAITKALKSLANEEIAAGSRRFFKTGAGQYGEGDEFLGIRVPEQRRVAKAYERAPLSEVEKLLHSPYHEVRLVALLILVRQFERGTDDHRQAVFDLYLSNTHRINNWDLVDLSAPNIVGAHLGPGEHRLLTRLAQSDSLWERRIAVLATLWFIRRGYHSETLRLATILMRDPADLIHKAVGWMLREVGKKDVSVLERFLEEYGDRLPRTALRYAIERLPESKRREYLALRRREQN